MPRYFFNIYHKRPNLDTEGDELPDSDTAWLAAIRTVGEILEETDEELTQGREWRLEVTDESGKVRYEIRINAERFS
jgi:hypothetical protein